MIRGGRLLFCDTLEGIRGRHCRLALRLGEPRDRSPEWAHALSWEGNGRDWTAVFNAPAADVRLQAAGGRAEVLEEYPLNLDEVFVAHTGGPLPREVDR